MPPLRLGQQVTPRIYADRQGVAQAAVTEICNMAAEALFRRGAFHLVLAGGATPKLAYQLLASADTEWSRWHIYYGDERCLPVADPERNSVMAQRAWLDHVAIPQNQIHPIPAERGAEVGAAEYAQVIAPVLPFDMVLLGMGEDGHTASLFPGHLHDEQELVHAVHHAPKPPSDRITLGYVALNATRRLLLLVTGRSKQEALARWAAGESLPVAGVNPECGVDLFLDREALKTVK